MSTLLGPLFAFSIFVRVEKKSFESFKIGTYIPIPYVSSDFRDSKRVELQLRFKR